MADSTKLLLAAAAGATAAALLLSKKDEPAAASGRPAEIIDGTKVAAESMLARTSVMHAVSEYGAAWTTQDADRIAALFTEDAVYVERAFDRNGTFVGRDEIREYWLRQICGKQSSIRFRHVERDLVLDATRPVAVVKWLAEFNNFREKRADKAEKRVRFCQVARLEFRGDQICYLEEYGQSVSGPSARWPPLDAPEDELAARIRKQFKEPAVAATCEQCRAPFASRSKLFAHLRATPCGDGVVSRPKTEPVAALCFTVSYASPPRLQEVLHDVVGPHGILQWAVPLRIAPAAISNRVAATVPKSRLKDLPGIVRRLQERLPEVVVRGADVADRPFAAERRQAERYIALVPWRCCGAAPASAAAFAPAIPNVQRDGCPTPFASLEAAQHVDDATVARMAHAARRAVELKDKGWLKMTKLGRVRCSAQEAPRAAWTRISISMRQPEPLFVNTLVAVLVAHARGVLVGDALDAALASETRPNLTPLPAAFVVLAGPVMTNFESKNNLGKPERDVRVSDAAQRHLARMVAADGPGESSVLGAWANML